MKKFNNYWDLYCLNLNVANDIKENYYLNIHMISILILFKIIKILRFK